MTDIPTEVKRMADIYRAFCKEFDIVSHKPDSESLRAMRISVFISGAKGTGQADCRQDPSISPPVPAQKDAGKPPASERKVTGDAGNRESTDPGLRKSNPVAPSNPDLSEKQINWLFSHGWTKEKIEAMTKKEAYWTINKAMKGGGQ